MHPLLSEIKEKLGTVDNISECSIRLFRDYGKEVVAEHSKQVATEAKRLALILNEESEKAEVAGVLHDISAVIPNDFKIEVTESLNLDILPEERKFPLIIHQKLSKEIARILFGISDESVLNAICCHTTLKANPLKLDMILFIADKIKWDQGGEPPYIDLVRTNMTKSLEHGVFAFLKYQYDNKSNLMVLHPWLVDAYNCLGMRLE